MDLTDLVGNTGVKQNAFGRSRLTGINMSHYADITGSFQRY